MTTTTPTTTFMIAAADPGGPRGPWPSLSLLKLVIKKMAAIGGPLYSCFLAPPPLTMLDPILDCNMHILAYAQMSQKCKKIKNIKRWIFSAFVKIDFTYLFDPVNSDWLVLSITQYIPWNNQKHQSSPEKLLMLFRYSISLYPELSSWAWGR